MKKFYKENRVFVILMGIVVICLIIILFMSAKYIIKSNAGDKYGNRLDGIKDVLVENNQKDEMIKQIKEIKNIKEASINVHGKIINFVVKFDKDATIDNMKSVAVKTLDFFTEEYRNYYDMQYLFSREVETKEGEDENNDVSTIIGYIKAGATTISWSNNAK